MWLQHRRSDPNSTTIIFQCVWCQLAAKRIVQQVAGPSFAWRQSFYCSGLDSSIGPNNLPCSNRESRGPRRRLDGCKSIHHTRSLNCAKGRTARLPTFRSYAVLTHCKPTVHAGCIRHKPRQQIMVCWHFHTRSRLHCQFDRSDMSFDDIC